jgi:hypothetical protein
MISNYNYNDYVALTEDPYDFRENDFIDFNQEGEIRRRRRQLDFFFDRIAKEDAKLHKSWLFGIGSNDFSQFSIFILKENILVSNSSKEEVVSIYSSQNLDLRAGHFWSGNPSDKIRASLGLLFIAGIPLNQKSSFELESYWYPSGNTGPLPPFRRVDTKPSNSLHSEASILLNVSMTVLKRFEVSANWGGSIGSIVFFGNRNQLFWMNNYGFGLAYALRPPKQD